MRLLILGFVLLMLVSCAGLNLTFNNKPCIIPFRDFVFKTCEEFRFRVNGRIYTVPAGFKTDLASVPRWYWSFMPPQKSEFIAPAVIHDYLYACTEHFTRRQADVLFYEALIQEGVDRSTALKMWLGVRMGGWFVYGEKGCHEYSSTIKGR